MLNCLRVTAVAGALVCAALPRLAQAADAAAADAAPLVGEVVVTAQKMPQNVQAVAAAVTVIEGTRLTDQNISDLTGLQNLTPAVRLQVENDVVQAFVRGIGSGFDAPWVPEAVATNFNGMSLPRHLTGASLYDIAAVEVLPGPQGTLYGRSAVGGVINIKAQRPTPTANADLLLNAGSDGLANGVLVLNAPLADGLAVRAAGHLDRNDGYASNGTYSEDARAARLSVLWRPDADTSVYAWAGYHQNRPRIGPIPYFPEQKHDPFTFPAFDSSSAAFYPPAGVPNDRSRGRYEGRMAGAEIATALGGLTVTYLPTYARYTGQDDRVIAGFYQLLSTRLRQATQELRLNSSGSSPLQVVGGGYWMHNATTQDYVFGRFFGGGRFPNVGDSYAVYGQATYAVTEGLRLTAGGRWSSDRTKDLHAEAIFPIFNPATLRFEKGVVPFAFRHTWTHVNWKAGFEADVADDAMLYGHVQTGFNPGSYDSNPMPVRADRLIRPQEVTAYTAGLKRRLLGGRLVLNAEVFYYDYKDQILQQYNAASGGIIIYNAPKSTIKGGQVDAAFAPTHHDRAYINVGITDARLDRFAIGGTDYAGFRLPAAPLATVALGYRRLVDLRGGATLALQADSYVSSSFWALFDHPRGSQQPAYTKTDLTLTFLPVHQRWDVSLWVKNLEDSVAIASAGSTAQPFPRSVVAYVEPPRAFGARVHARFGR